MDLVARGWNDVLLAAVAAHVAAALWHHFIRRDAVLDAMLPGRSRMATRHAAEPASVARRAGVSAPIED